MSSLLLRASSVLVSMYRQSETFRLSVISATGRRDSIPEPLELKSLTDPNPSERVLVWPEEKQAWIEENRGCEVALTPVVLDALNGSGGAGRYTVLHDSNGTLVTGPISSILLHGGGEIEAFVTFLRTGDR